MCIPRINVHGALSLVGANKQAWPRMPVAFKASALKVVARKVLWYSESFEGRWAKSFWTVPRQAPVM